MPARLGPAGLGCVTITRSPSTDGFIITTGTNRDRVTAQIPAAVLEALTRAAAASEDEKAESWLRTVEIQVQDLRKISRLPR